MPAELQKHTLSLLGLSSGGDSVGRAIAPDLIDPQFSKEFEITSFWWARGNMNFRSLV